MTARKLFISYSWSSPDHEEWVLNLAEELVGAGVDVILDKWDLKEGHDANAFMEKMVTDPDVNKVAIISDETYADKANGRKGGVGTETQIISAEVYASQEQGKFVVVLPSRDDQGNPFLPVYYKSRIYIDLSDHSTYAENFERLLRWVHDKPLRVKPVLGRTPDYLLQDDNPALGTGVTFRRAVDAISSVKPHALGALDDYLASVEHALGQFRLKSNDTRDFDEKVVSSIDSMVVIRNELETLTTSLCRFMDSEASGTRLHRFFERLIPWMAAPADVSSYREWDFDNFRYLSWELYLLCVATALKNEAFSIATQLVRQPYFNERSLRYGGESMGTFSLLQQETASFEHRKVRLQSRRASLKVDLFKKRCDEAATPLPEVMQADFLLFICGLVATGADYRNWRPETLIYLGHGQRPFKMFSRCLSKEYAKRVLSLMGLDEQGLKKIIAELREPEARSCLHYGHLHLDAGSLLNIDTWGTHP